MKPFIISFCIFLFLLSACANVAIADPIAVTASPYSTPWVAYTPSSYPLPTLSFNIVTPGPSEQPSTMPPVTITQGSSTCTFPLAETTTEESIPENYVFAEPRVVLADPNSGFDIIQWLPDNERALIVRNVIANQYVEFQSIELFSPRLVKVQTFARRSPTYHEPPIWMAGLNAIMYPERVLISSSYDDRGMVIPSSIVVRELLWLNDGDIDNAQILEDVHLSPALVPHEWVVSSLAAKPDGSQIVYLVSNGEQPYQLHSRKVSQGLMETAQQFSFDVPQWDWGNASSSLDIPVRMAWRTGASQIFFYSYASPTEQAFLMDIDTGQVCELNFGGWVYWARWSANGRYLAVIRSRARLFPISESYDLAVLDTATGRLYQLDSTQIGPPEMKGCCRHIISDFAWAPDNRHLAVIGATDFTGTGPHNAIRKIYLVDFLSGQVDDLFPSKEFISNFAGSSLAWSSDGSKVLALCPEICLISVQKGDP